MDILLTTPFAHPHVHRGAERYAHDLGRWLARRGHTVTHVTSAPDADADVVVDGVSRRYRRRRKAVGSGRAHIDDLLRAAPAIRRGLRGLRPQVAQVHHYVDGAAVRSSRRHPPYVIWVPGVARQASLGGRPLHRAAFRFAASGAARIHTLSAHAAAALADELGVQSTVVPPGVATERFAGERPAVEAPTVVCAAAADDPRKHVDLLVQAFPAVLRARPDARLRLISPRPEPAHALLAHLDPAARARTDVVDGRDADVLAAQFRSATVSVLPSTDEAFGLVVVESLAAGTPVVGTRHGAIPEIVRDDAVGRLFPAGDAAGLARAVVDGLELGADPATAARCRQAAAAYDWDVVGPRLEEIYAALG